jgi:uncharacterized pyridoxal phosphate-containing UPF0001 family protein
LNELADYLQKNPLHHVQIKGMMGMASFTEDNLVVEKEFTYLRSLYDQYKSMPVPGASFDTLSMGMSGDYTIAVRHGSNMVRIGSILFGARQLS